MHEALYFRFYMQAQQALMDTTLGEESAFVEGTVEEVLDRARAATRAETEAALRVRSEQTAAAETRAAEAEMQVVAVESQRAEDKLLQRGRVRDVSTRLGFILRRALWGLGILIVAFCAYAGLPKPLPGLPREFGPYGPVAGAILIAGASFGVANPLFGSNLWSAVRWIKVLATD